METQETITLRVPRFVTRLRRSGGQLGPRLARWLLPTPGNVLFTLLVVGGLLWAASAGALPLRAPAAAGTSTGTIAYQGRLADANGSPLTGTYNMIFRLYDAASGGTPLWEEQWTGSNGVRVSDGLFNVMLGSLTPIPQSVITGHDSLFLGITVGTDDEMTPRVQLGSVPFAVQALTVPDGSITTAKIADGAVTSKKTSLTSGKVNVSTDFDLPETAWQYVDLPGTSRTLTVETPQTLLVTVVADLSVDPGCFAGVELVVDNVRAGTGAGFSSGSGSRSSVAQTYAWLLTPGSHTVKLQAVRIAGTGLARVWGHTNYLYLLVGQ
jgi:hypothetical protein